MAQSSVFYRFAPFIQDYIYRSGWKELRGVQLDAARVLFESDANLLLCSATASGKTEAAYRFFTGMGTSRPRIRPKRCGSRGASCKSRPNRWRQC